LLSAVFYIQSEGFLNTFLNHQHNINVCKICIAFITYKKTTGHYNVSTSVIELKKINRSQTV